MTRMLIFAILAVSLANKDFNPSPKKNAPTKPFDVITYYTLEASGAPAKNFMQLAKDPSETNLKFKLVDCLENKFYCEDLGITKFPTIQHNSNNKITTYRWAHTFSDYLEYINKVPFDVIAISLQSQMEEFTSHSSAFVLFFNPELRGIVNMDYIDQYMRLSRLYKHTHVYLGACGSGEIAHTENLSRDDMPALLQVGEDAAYRYTLKNLTYESMLEFIEKHKCTMKFTVTDGNWDEALDCFEGKVAGISFIHTGNDNVEFNPNHLNMLAHEFRLNNEERFQFAVVNIDQFPEIAKRFGVSKGPEFLLVDFRTEAQAKTSLGKFDLTKHEDLKIVLEKIWNEGKAQESEKANIELKGERKNENIKVEL